MSFPELPSAYRSVHQPWIARLSALERLLVGSAVAVVVFAGGGFVDFLVTHHYLPPTSLMIAGAAVASALGLLVYRVLTDIQERYRAIMDRLRLIAELNHHIRNALQVIAYHNVPERSARAVQQVTSAVIRIESVLREVFTDRSDQPY